MTAQDAFFAFYTLLLGLGIAGLLSGLAGIVRRHRTRQIGGVGAMLAVLILFEFLTAWSGAARFVTVDDARVASLLLPFATGACYFLASVLLFPDAADEGGMADVKTYIAGQVRTLASLLFAANLLLILLEVPDVLAKAPRSPGYLAFPRRRAAGLAMAALLLVYVVVFALRRV